MRGNSAEHHPHSSNLHDLYLKERCLGYYDFSEAENGAYLLFTTYAPPEENLQTTLFLITNDVWFRRFSGSWLEVNDDQIVGDNGEFRGALVSPSLENMAVMWWDSLRLPPSNDEVLAYCAAFPVFRFEIDITGRVTDLLLETDNGTWGTDTLGWNQRRHTPAAEIDKQRNVETFVMRCRFESRNLAEEASAFARHTSDTPIREAIRLGLMSFVNPALAVEARDWLTGTSRNRTVSDAAAFLASTTSARFILDGDTVHTLVIDTGDIPWIRERGRWVTANSEWQDVLSKYERCVDIDDDRITEITAWWDHRKEDTPEVVSIPENHASSNVVTPQHGNTVQYVVLDGKRAWSRMSHEWSVEPCPVNSDPYDSDEDEPWTEERLPDWFYNA